MFAKIEDTDESCGFARRSSPRVHVVDDEQPRTARRRRRGGDSLSRVHVARAWFSRGWTSECPRDPADSTRPRATIAWLREFRVEFGGLPDLWIVSRGDGQRGEKEAQRAHAYTRTKREKERNRHTRARTQTRVEGREDSERRTAKEGSARRDHRIRQSNGGFSTDDDKDTRQRSPTLYFAFNDQGTSTAESGGLRPPVGF